MFASLIGNSHKYLQNESPEVISLFVGWLYRDKIPNGNSQAYLDSLYSLYVFGKTIGVDKLVDDTMDKIQDISLTYDQYIDVDRLLRIYQETVADSDSLLRMFGVHLFIYKAWKKKSHLRAEVPVEQNSSREAAMKQRQREQPPFLSDSELRELWEKTRENFDLHKDIFNYCQEWSSLEMMDPRERNENDTADRCTFHCHVGINTCRQSESNEVPSWVG